MKNRVEEDESTGGPKDVDADDEEYGLVIMKAIQEDGEELLSTLDSALLKGCREACGPHREVGVPF